MTPRTRRLSTCSASIRAAIARGALVGRAIVDARAARTPDYAELSVWPVSR